MNGLIKVSEAAALGLHAMAYLYLDQSRLISAHEMAQTIKISEAHLAKVMQKLERAGLVTSKRGPTGGFSLKPHAESISLLQIYEVVEGKIKAKVCLQGKPICTKDCPLGALLQYTIHDLQQKLAQIKLPVFAQKSGIRAGI